MEAREARLGWGRAPWGPLGCNPGTSPPPFLCGRGSHLLCLCPQGNEALRASGSHKPQLLSRLAVLGALGARRKQSPGPRGHQKWKLQVAGLQLEQDRSSLICFLARSLLCLTIKCWSFSGILLTDASLTPNNLSEERLKEGNEPKWYHSLWGISSYAHILLLHQP